MDGYSDSAETPQLLPPPPGSFIDREELIQFVGEYAVSQGYVVTIKQSKKDRVVVLGCDRGGVYRNRRKPVDDTPGEGRKRKPSSRLTNCPFELLGKKEEGLWVLSVRNGSHNHEPMKDLSEHPSARRFSEKEVLLIKEMTEAGLKPRQILKRLRQSNPELSSTPKHVYNVKTKLRQGNFTVKRFKSLKPQISPEGSPRPSTSITTEPFWRKRYPLRFPNFIGGRFVDSQSSTSIDVINPATQEIVAQVPFTTVEEFKAAVFAAKRAFLAWRSTSVATRQRIMFKLQELIRRDIDKIASSVTTEQGKALKDARSEVSRGLEVVEHASGMATMQMGEFVSNMSNGTDTYSIREPLGVCAGICPFSFPAMIPLWMIASAIACGNTFILKPSVRDPGASMILAELAIEAGLPSGVLNIVHGTNDIINAICDDDDIKAVSFVGSDTAGMYVHQRATTNGKRVQFNVGLRNHAIVMPDASMDATLNAIVGAGFGAAGQACTSLSTVIFVGSSKLWEDKLVEHAKAVKVNAGTERVCDLGPVISKQAKERICRLIQESVDNGARLVLDGRQIMVPGYEMGNFIGPTILSDVTPNLELFKEEVAGPVLLCIQADSLDEAMGIVNKNKYGNGATIFTASRSVARKFRTEIEVGQVGINVPVQTPLPFFSVTSSKLSYAGDLNFYGKDGIHFYTHIKTVTQFWNDFPMVDEGPSASKPEYLQAPDGSFLALQSIDNSSREEEFPVSAPKDFLTDDGVSLTLQSSGNGVSLGLQSIDLHSGAELPQGMALPDGFQWAPRD